MSDAEEELALHLKAAMIDYDREYRWDDSRRWRADFMLAYGPGWLIEVEGGHWAGGHRRGAEADKDCERSNAAQMDGWNVLRFTPAMVSDGRALACIERALGRS